MNVGACRIELARRLDFHQRQGIFFLTLIDPCQAEVRIHQPRVAAQRLAVTLFGVVVVLQEPIQVSQFVIVQSEIGFDGGVFQEFVACPRIILLLHVGVSQVEMHEGKLGIRLGRGLKLFQRRIVLVEIEMIFADEEMIFRRAVAEFDQLRGGAVVEFLAASPVSRV